MNESSERVFFCTENGAHKFWRVSVCRETQTVCWGRIGTAGQTLERTFVDFNAAQSATDALIAQKIAKGYAQVSAEQANTVVPVPRLGQKNVSQLLLFDEKEAGPAASTAPLSLF